MTNVGFMNLSSQKCSNIAATKFPQLSSLSNSILFLIMKSSKSLLLMFVASIPAYCSIAPNIVTLSQGAFTSISCPLNITFVVPKTFLATKSYKFSIKSIISS